MYGFNFILGQTKEKKLNSMSFSELFFGRIVAKLVNFHVSRNHKKLSRKKEKEAVFLLTLEFH